MLVGTLLETVKTTESKRMKRCLIYIEYNISSGHRVSGSFVAPSLMGN